MKRLILLSVLVLFLVGCKAPAGVVKATEDMAQPVSAMADRYAALVKELKIKDVHKLQLLDEMETDLEQFHQLHLRVVEWMEGKDVFDIGQASEFAGLILEIREKLKKDEDG